MSKISRGGNIFVVIKDGLPAVIFRKASKLLLPMDRHGWYFEVEILIHFVVLACPKDEKKCAHPRASNFVRVMFCWLPVIQVWPRRCRVLE